MLATQLRARRLRDFALRTANKHRSRNFSGALKGHGFSRAKEVAQAASALAAEGMHVTENSVSQGLKPWT
jgi:hypothetical protein